MINRLNTQAIIIEMLPSIPKPFSRQTLIDHWPQAQRIPSAKHLSDTLRALYIRRRIQIHDYRRGHEVLYDAIPMPEPRRSKQEKAWWKLRAEMDEEKKVVQAA